MSRVGREPGPVEAGAADISRQEAINNRSRSGWFEIDDHGADATLRRVLRRYQLKVTQYG